MNMKKLDRFWVFILKLLVVSFYMANAELDENKSAWGLFLPEPITSFGACNEDGFLYVYGGHIGDAHVYFKDSYSKSFVRLNLTKRTKKWDLLPFNDPLQGFGMAADRGKIYVSGGSHASNDEGEESNLSSTSKVSVFCIKNKKWSDFISLPNPRSSHEMVAHKGKLYIIGGWHMKNGKGVNWYKHGLYIDLRKSPLVWKKLPSTKWLTRANSAAVVNDYLYVVGGLNNEGTTNAVNRLDLKKLKWEQIKDFPGTNRIKAFGSASAAIGGKLLVSPFSYQPRLYNDSNQSWYPSKAKVTGKRFFHRIVPINKTDVLFIGGASWDGHLDNMEILNFAPDLGKEKLRPQKDKHKQKSTFWGGFRGSGNSVTANDNLPLEWSEGQNIAWRKPLIGYGQSTPVLWEDFVFSTSTLGDHSEKSLVQCHNLSDGSLKWQKIIRSPVRIERNQYVSQAAPSPVVDDSGVYTFFENGLLLGFDHDGGQIWKRSLIEDYGPIKGNHGLGSSLFQSETSIGLLVDHAGPSYLLKVNKKNGKNAWKLDRPERVSWSTPTYFEKNDREIVFVSSNGVVECYNFETGVKIWGKGGIEGNTVASPTYSGDLLVVGSSKPDHTKAFRNVLLNSYDLQLAWNAEDATCSFASPLLTEKFLYLVNRAGVATCHDLKNGQKKWDLRLPGPCWASPLHAPNRVYFFTKDGETIVLNDNGTTEKLAENKIEIDGRVYGFAAGDSQFVLRTGNELICIKKDNN